MQPEEELINGDDSDIGFRGSPSARLRLSCCNLDYPGCCCNSSSNPSVFSPSTTPSQDKDTEPGCPASTGRIQPLLHVAMAVRPVCAAHSGNCGAPLRLSGKISPSFDSST